jgi:hypothetical protein
MSADLGWFNAKDKTKKMHWKITKSAYPLFLSKKVGLNQETFGNFIFSLIW